jgi:molybdate transport system substrate-binding protein
MRLATTLAIWLLAGPAPAPSAPVRRDLVVFEAASLKDAFARLAETFEAEHPGVKVIANAAGSQELRAQIEHGAAADVFASADRKHMDAVRAAHLVGEPVVFACNQPIVVVRTGTGAAAAIKSFADLPRAERIVVGTPEVPIGAYAIRILDAAAARFGAAFKAAVEARVVSRELNVRQVLAKVALGEADAGIVYGSDAARAGDKVRVVPIPNDLNLLAEYPIAPVTAGPAPDLARAWIKLVTSPAGKAVLRDFGFVACP